MIRFVLLAALAVLVWLAVLGIVRALRSRSIDWPGVAVAIGFVALAFWLRDLTGMG